jgi:eukaryotic-like serine/threonine-protein kinase
MTTVRGATPPSLPAGYVIERELGGGGMARILLAREVALDRRVVVKVLPADLAQGLSAERFAREIAVAARLQDPHIVPVLTAGTTPEGLPYYTMPFVDGESLRARLVARPAANGPLPMAESVTILRDVARALEYAHARGVVHRDIKPENVLLAGRGALVADFGIAKAMADARKFLPARHDDANSSAGSATGTPAYMAPEQAAVKAVHAATDLYAWGVLAWELLAGRHPFSDRASARELMTAHVSAPAPALRDAAPAVPAPLAALVMQCLKKDPRDRPASATALLEELAAVSDGGAALLPAARRVVASGRTVRWRRALIAGGAGALGTLAAVIAWQQLSKRAAAPVVAEARARSASLAVLPFEHQGDSADAYLTEGIGDEIRGRLAGVPDLVVIARASSEQYRGSAKTPRQMAEELGVRWLLTGTVRVLGSGDARRVLVRPELVEVPGDGAPRSRWGEPFDAQGGDVLRVQGEIAARVVDAMEVAVTRADRERVVQVASRDAQAYDAYLRGQAELQYGADVGPEAQARAITRFEEAVLRDSLLLDAWVALARARTLLYVNGRERTPALASSVRDAVERVAALDPRGARGHLARGIWQRLVARDYPAARREFESAAQLDPGDMRAAANLALLLEEDLGQAAAALPHFERARAIDPRNVIVWRAHARALAAVGRFDEARVAADRARALAPTNQESAQVRLEVELAAGDTVAARAVLPRLLDELPPGRASLIVATTAGWLLDEPAARRQLAVGADAFDGDRGQWALRRAELLAQRGDLAGARQRADSARPMLSAAAARPTSSALALADAAMAEALAARTDAARVAANRAVAQLRDESGTERGSSWASSLYPIACAASRAGARDSAIAWLQAMRSVPSVHTAARVRADPCFAPLRADRRFTLLTADTKR